MTTIESVDFSTFPMISYRKFPGLSSLRYSSIERPQVFLYFDAQPLKDHRCFFTSILIYRKPTGISSVRNANSQSSNISKTCAGLLGVRLSEPLSLLPIF